MDKQDKKNVSSLEGGDMILLALVIALFDLGYFKKKFVCTIPHSF
jgi:hypothetical protein